VIEVTGRPIILVISDRTLLPGHSWSDPSTAVGLCARARRPILTQVGLADVLCCPRRVA